MPTILYIEDNLYNVQLVERLLLQRPDIQLLTSVQGSPGIGIAQVRHPDLILLDVHLPDINGFDVLEKLRLDPSTANIPIVVLSADETPARTSTSPNHSTSSFSSPSSTTTWARATPPKSRPSIPRSSSSTKASN